MPTEKGVEYRLFDTEPDPRGLVDVKARMARRLYALALYLAGCGVAAAPPPRGEQVDTQRPTPAAAPAPGACDTLVAPLAVQRRRDGIPTRIYVRAVKDGQPALLYFDTGSHRSHLFHALDAEAAERPIANAGHVAVGCLDLTLASWRHRVEPTFEGLDVVATLGSEFLEGRATELDLRTPRLIRRAAGAPVDEGAEWMHLPIEVVKGIVIASVTIDGKPTRLSVDTGAWNVQVLDPDLVISSDPRELSVAHDVFGHELTFVNGTARLGLGDAPARTVAISRTRAFPAFERQRKDLGGAMDGLLGLSSFGASRIVFDLPRGEIRFAR